MAADSKVASRFAYDVLVKEGETAAGKGGPGAKRGKDGHVQLASGDDFFSAPLSTSGRKASGRLELDVITPICLLSLLRRVALPALLPVPTAARPLAGGTRILPCESIAHKGCLSWQNILLLRPVAGSLLHVTKPAHAHEI